MITFKVYRAILFGLAFASPSMASAHEGHDPLSGLAHNVWHLLHDHGGLIILFFVSAALAILYARRRTFWAGSRSKPLSD